MNTRKQNTYTCIPMAPLSLDFKTHAYTCMYIATYPHLYFYISTKKYVNPNYVPFLHTIGPHQQKTQPTSLLKFHFDTLYGILDSQSAVLDLSTPIDIFLQSHCPHIAYLGLNKRAQKKHLSSQKSLLDHS